MSGHVADWIKIDHYLLNGGAKMAVTDYFFTASDAPYVPNTDKLMVEFGGAAQDCRNLEPLSAPIESIPPHIKTGEIVEFGQRGEHVEFVRRTWLKQHKDSTQGTVMVEFENYPFSIEASKISALSEKNLARAEIMRKEKADKERRLKIIAEMDEKRRNRPEPCWNFGWNIQKK